MTSVTKVKGVEWGRQRDWNAYNCFRDDYGVWDQRGQEALTQAADRQL